MELVPSAWWRSGAAAGPGGGSRGEGGGGRGGAVLPPPGSPGPCPAALRTAHGENRGGQGREGRCRPGSAAESPPLPLTYFPPAPPGGGHRRDPPCPGRAERIPRPFRASSIRPPSARVPSRRCPPRWRRGGEEERACAVPGGRAQPAAALHNRPPQ